MRHVLTLRFPHQCRAGVVALLALLALALTRWHFPPPGPFTSFAVLKEGGVPVALALRTAGSGSEAVLFRPGPHDRWRVSRPVRLAGRPLGVWAGAFRGPSFTVASTEEITLLDPQERVLGRYVPDKSLRVFDAAPLPAGGNSLLLALLGEPGAARAHTLLVLSLATDPPREVYREEMPAFQPWRVFAADVNGGGPEVVLAAHKPARFDPQPANRPFVFSWEGERIFPLWLGSRLAHPFTGLAAADLDGDGRDELLATETTREGRAALGVYVWDGFGFVRVAGTAMPGSELHLTVAPPRPGFPAQVWLRESARSPWQAYSYDKADGRLAPAVGEELPPAAVGVSRYPGRDGGVETVILTGKGIFTRQEVARK